MDNQSKAIVLRIFLSSTDKYNSEILFEKIVFMAREAGLAGASVFKGMLGYGASSIIHSYKFWEVSEKLPVVVEIIDDEEKVMSFYENIRPVLESMRYGCLVAMENIKVLLHKQGHK